MRDWLSDYWEFVVTTLIALASVAYAWHQRRTCTLDWTVLAASRLLSRHAKTVESSLAVTDRDMPLKGQDFATPVAFDFDPDDELLDASIGDVSTPGLIADSDLAWVVRGDSNLRITAQPTLPNPREWFDVQFVFEGRHGPPKVSARYAGLSRPMANWITRSDSFLRGMSWSSDVLPRRLGSCGASLTVSRMRWGHSCVFLLLLLPSLFTRCGGMKSASVVREW
jgi:hypothetical protein